MKSNNNYVFTLMENAGGKNNNVYKRKNHNNIIYFVFSREFYDVSRATNDGVVYSGLPQPDFAEVFVADLAFINAKVSAACV